MSIIAALAFARSNWKAAAGIIMGALLCWPIASCDGRNQANTANALKVARAALKAQAAAEKAESAANLVDLIAVAKRTGRTKELEVLVNEKSDDSAAGPGVRALLERLRKERR